MLYKLILFYIVGLSGAMINAAQLSKSEWSISSGTLTYHVNFPVKKVKGVSKSVRGKGKCESGLCKFLLAVPLKSFESDDGNRDNHMLEVTKAAVNPMVVVQVAFKEDFLRSEIPADIEIQFAGQKHHYDKILISTAIQSNLVSTKGVIPIKLSEFNIERPSLLGVKIDDDVKVEFDISWQ